MRHPETWWEHFHDLIAHGHGPLENILDNYTLDHVNHFLAKIDARQRRERVRSLYDDRMVQCDLKHFKEHVRRLEEQDRLIRLNEARRAGRRNATLEMTQREAEVLDHQGHDYFGDWTPMEQERFKAQQGAMWELIPEKFKAKAERLATGH